MMAGDTMEILKNTDCKDVECPHCKSVLRITKQDVRDCEFSNYYTICAVCERSFDLDHLPQAWIRYIHRDDPY